MTADPHPRDESSERATPASDASVCPLCGEPVHESDLRCPSCNMTLAGVGGRPGPFNRRVLWWWAGGLVLIYLVALAVVALIPA